MVFLEAGEGIPADGWLRKGTLQCDQAALSGESREVKISVFLSTFRTHRILEEVIVGEADTRFERGACFPSEGACL